MSNQAQPLWLRCEKKQFERRAALTPTTSKKLIEAGYTITVERDEQRIFEDKEYEEYVKAYTPVIPHSPIALLPEWAARSFQTTRGQRRP